MSQNLEEYTQLASMMKHHLLEEYQNNDWIISDPSTCHYFRTGAKKQESPNLASPNPNFRSGAQKQDFSNLASPNPNSLLPNTIPPKSITLKPIQAKNPMIQPIQNTPRPPAPKPIARISKQIPPPREVREKIVLTKSTTVETNTSFCEEFQNLLSENQIIKEIPNDQRAREVCDQWKSQKNAEVIIYTKNATGNELVFLENIARAIAQTYCPAIVCQNNEFENNKLCLIIATEPLNNIPSEKIDLDQNNPNNKVLQIKAPSHYLIDPILKRELWHEIKSRLSIAKKNPLNT